MEYVVCLKPFVRFQTISFQLRNGILNTGFICLSLLAPGESIMPYQRAHGVMYSFIFSIIGSVAGTAYWGPVAGRGSLSHDLDKIREERRKNMPVVHGLIQGPIEAVPAGTDAEHYTKIHKKDIEKEEN